MSPSLAGKTALITGGGSGIGLGIARALAAAGVQVAISGRRAEVLEAAAASITEGPKVLTHLCDVANRESVKTLLEWAYKTLSKIDILVNAAGINIKTRAMGNMEPHQWDEVMQTNATGVYNCLYYALPGMRDRKEGLIINISSTSGKRAMPLGGIAYNASKFAVDALGTGVANEESANGIRVTNIFPGEVDTPILANRPQPVSAERRAKMLLPEDLGHMVVAIAQLPPRAHIPELIIKPLVQDFA
ncbi:short-chain dehydrogenase/reductase SDR [Pirellula staleyi DSM 6068]|uniref:Short-chain dehydrogenase/reductase SDR n=1 Tax=Pirellula staleyi (strain ATCC 27377 / DSM 6068 / ICPB 4128) TaxID=530564 RepID=D2R787_PIRSD|nr:SDR family oxidoreductase [Pirellula staleyi]ADB15583.1 short-chain dehydrogenase/reductase SDR [Pirellula staleyi DSM 6068]